MWKQFFKGSNDPEPPLVTLARSPELDQATAYCICRLIDCVGTDLRKQWPFDWQEAAGDDYRSLLTIPLLQKAWRLLIKKDWLSLQSTSDLTRRISTVAPLAGLVRLKSLVLQNNYLQDLTPLSGLTNLTYLNCFQNRIADLTALRNFQGLEELLLTHNPVTSVRVLEDLPTLRELSLSTDQIARFVECKRLAKLGFLEVESVEGEWVEDCNQWPEMPALKVLKIHNVKDLRGIERFGTLETVELCGAQCSDLAPLARLRRTTHLGISTSQPVDVEPLAQLHALRELSLTAPKAIGLGALSSLPALREVEVAEHTSLDADELNDLRQDLAPWEAEFKDAHRGLKPSLEIQVVDQETFDHDDSKVPFGMRPGELEDGMFKSEREWLVDQIYDALSVDFEEETDFLLPGMNGGQRSERLVLYSVKAYESVRDIVLAVQRILCETRNDWIIWFQSCLREGSEGDEVPDNLDDFKVWIYPDKIVATKTNANTVRKLIEWET